MVGSLVVVGVVVGTMVVLGTVVDINVLVIAAGVV